MTDSLTDPRRRRAHLVRQAFRINNWHTLAHRHRRHVWKAALKKFRGRRIAA